MLCRVDKIQYPKAVNLIHCTLGYIRIGPENIGGVIRLPDELRTFVEILNKNDQHSFHILSEHKGPSAEVFLEYGEIVEIEG